MAYLLGEQIQLGIGVEDVRGTAVEPQVWIPARAPAGITTVEEAVMIKETRGSGISSEGREIVQLRAEGELEFNIRNTSIGYILKSLLGSVSSSTASGATTHTFTRQTTGAQHPSLTLALAMPGQQSYKYPLSVASKLEVKTPIDDLANAKVGFVAKSEDDHAAYSPSFAANDVFFRNHDITIKFADDYAGLAAAQGVCVKEFNLTIANNAKPSQCIGSMTPSDILTLVTELSGSFSVNFDGPEDYYDIFKAGTYKAIRITMERTDLPELGTSSGKYPMVQITLPKVSFSGYKPGRPLADIVTEAVDFSGHYDETHGAIEVVLQNELATYNAVAGS